MAKLFDAPLHHDPLAWWTAGLTALVVAALATSTQPSPLPRWLDTLLGTIVMTFLFAIIPAMVRLKFRRWTWRRRQAAGREQQPVALGFEADAASDRNLSTQVPVEPGAAGRVADAARSPSFGNSDRAPRSTAVQQVVSEPSLASDEAVKNSALLQAARELQYPVARAVRALQAASTPKEQYESLLDVADALSITVGASAAAWLRSADPEADVLGELRQAYDRGVTQGTWQTVTRRAAQHAAGDPTAPPGFTDAASHAKKHSLLASLDELTQERNRWAHGSAPRTPADAQQRVVRLLPVLEIALRRAGYLAQAPWIVTHSSSYQVRHQHFVVSASFAMGDHPEFERRRLISSRPLADGRVHLMADGDVYVDLTPFVVIRHCEVCSLSELFYADRLPRGSMTVLKSFGSGHVMTDKALDAEIDGLA